MSVYNFINKKNLTQGDGALQVNPSSFGEVVSASFDSTRDNYLTDSQARLESEAFESQLTKYKEITGLDFREEYKADITKQFSGQTKFDGMMPDMGQAETDFYKTKIQELKTNEPDKYAELLDFDGIKNKARQKALKSDEELQMAQMGADRFTGLAGGLVGGFAAGFTDPLNLATIPLGAGPGMSVLKSLAVEAGANMAVEVATQPVVSKWQKELGKEYDFGEMASNVLMAGATGAGFTGVIKGVPASSRLLFAKASESKAFNKIQKTALKYMERYQHIKEKIPSFKKSPEIDEIELHSRNLKEAELAIEEGRPMNVEFDVEKLNKEIEEMGLDSLPDTDFNNFVRAYHGTFKEFKSADIKPSESGYYGPGVYLNTDKNRALYYGDNVHTFKVDDSKFLDLVSGDIPARIKKVEKELGLEIKEYIPGSKYDDDPYWGIKAAVIEKYGNDVDYELKTNELLSEAGYEGIRFRHNNSDNNLVVFKKESLGLDGINEELGYSKLETLEEQRAKFDESGLAKERQAQDVRLNEMLEKAENKDMDIVLEDGESIKLSELKEEFASDESYVKALQSCAIGQ